MLLVRWLSAFLVTQAVEVPIYAYGLAGTAQQRLQRAFTASLLTHPVVWFVVFPVASWLGLSYRATFVVAETFAVVVETIYLARFGLRRPLLWAIGANASSVVVGFTLRSQFGWP